MSAGLWGPPPPPPPKTALGRYRNLCPRAGIAVSPFCLGGLSIGDQWNDFGFGVMDKESSFKLLDAFYDAGGNFMDAANNYQDESSEKFIGEWMETRGIRDQIVLATKYTANFRRAGEEKIKANFVGNHSKSIHLSVNASLAKLRTSYIDVLYLHWWDYNTSVEEVMDVFHNLIVQGKVLYLGVSDTPAWIVSKANQYARDHGKSPFVVYQGAWNVMNRDFEREIIPMARSEGMALAPWNVGGGGRIRTDAEEERRRQMGEQGRQDFPGEWERTPEERKVCQALEKVAGEVGTEHITAVAIAYCLQKTPYVYPIIGGRKVEHLLANIEALSINLTTEQIKAIEDATPFTPGFPHNIVGDGTKNTFLISAAANFDKQPVQQAIRPVAFEKSNRYTDVRS